MAATLAELETRVIRLEQQYSTLNTRDDVETLSDLNDVRNQARVTAETDLETRISNLEDSMLSVQTQVADHETRITALE